MTPQEKDILVGREAPANVIVRSKLVSRRHAIITIEAGVATIHDLNSANGTFVNGQRITESRIEDGDRVRFADAAYVLRDGSLAPVDAASLHDEGQTPQRPSLRKPLAWVVAGLGAAVLTLVAVLVIPPIIGGVAQQKDLDLYSQPAQMANFVSEIEESVVTVYCETDTVTATGSGFAASPDDSAGATRTIITNHHVIEECAGIPGSISVEGRSFRSPAALVSDDPVNDLAALRIDHAVRSLPLAPQPPVGIWVAAFGSPHGIAGTVTQGTISNVSDREKIVATDAAINRGNSGGPLLNANGEVIGINSFRLEETSTIGFARGWPQLCSQILECPAGADW